MIDFVAQKLPGGMHPSQKEAYDSSAALTFLDLRVPFDPAADEADAAVRNKRRAPRDAAIDEAASVRVRPTARSFAGRFVTKAHGVLTDVFLRHGLQLHVSVDGDTLCATLVEQAGQTPVTEARARALAAQLESSIAEKPEAFKWDELCENLVAESKALIGSLKVSDPADGPAPGPDEWEAGVLPNLDKERAAKITPEKIVPIGMPSLEFLFSAGGSQILYPDPHVFTEDHWDLWKVFSPYAATRGMLDYVYSAVLWLPHEVLHCVQDGAMGSAGAGRDTALSNWQCEYCVCHGQTLMLAALIGEHRKRGPTRSLMVPAHFMEEVLMWLEACAEGQEAWSGAGKAWEDCRGAAAPPTSPEQPYEYMEENPAAYLAILARIVLTAFEKQQGEIEIDEQVTSYWAEYVKVLCYILFSLFVFCPTQPNPTQPHTHST